MNATKTIGWSKIINFLKILADIKKKKERTKEKKENNVTTVG